jgi:erythronate-4-phosphate dehydrogenase
MRTLVDAKIPFAREAFGMFGDVIACDAKEIDRRSVRNVEILVVRSETRVDGALLEGSRVRFVGTATIGTDHVDVEYLRVRGIGFASAPGSNANSVAEYVVAALLVLARRFGLTLQEMTLGIVGVGNIGRRVVNYAGALGMRILQNDPPLARQTGNAAFVPLERLMDADIITLHVPLTRSGEDPTFHFFDEGRIAKMKKRSILINTARGGVTETVALKEALKAGHLGAAVLDVWEHEPRIDPDLLTLAELGTPHVAGYSLDGKVIGTRMIYDAVCHRFGFQASWSPPDGLGGSVLPPFKVKDVSAGMERILRECVRQSYDIERDDGRLRQMLSLGVDRHVDFFRNLRREYPERLEFSHRKVVLPENGTELGSLLVGLGFQVGYEAG